MPKTEQIFLHELLSIVRLDIKFITLNCFLYHTTGLNQLLWYFADLERQKCYVLPGGLPDWENTNDACMKWRRFGK